MVIKPAQLTRRANAMEYLLTYLEARSTMRTHHQLWR